MGTYTAGSVSAKITLDTKDFDISLDKVTERISKLKTSFSSAKGDNLSKTVDTLKKKINKYQKEITNLEKVLKEYNITQNNTASSNTKVANSYNEMVANAQKAIPVVQRLSRTEKEALEAKKALFASKGEFLSNRNISKATQQLKVFEKTNRSLANRLEHIKRITSADLYNVPNLSKATKAMSSFDRQLRSTPVNLKRMGQQAKASSTQFSATAKQISTATRALQLFNTQARGFGTAFNPSEYAMKNASVALNTFERGLRSTNVNLTENTKITQNHSNSVKKGEGYIKNYTTALKDMYNTFLGLKTVMTMIGGMYVWQGVMDVVEGVKTTLKSKSEMESQLQTLGVSDGGIILFNKALDDTAKKFQKINKYQVGETVSSIGLEFQLSAKEMAESMDVISMITSEYIRAGRNEDEAALAVKDILQGEFQRLSRETGIGKNDLQEKYGWDGDTENITGLMEALRKAGQARHWDVFAKKATSINDVLQITKNRFSEFGADLADKATPLITGAFNAILDSIGFLKSGFEGLDSIWQNAIVFGTIPASIIGIATAATMVSKGFGLAEIATVGWSKSILTMVFNLEKAEVASYGLRKALVASITGTKASELANIGAGKALAARVLGVDKAVLAEKGLLSALTASKASLKEGLDLTKQSIGYELTRSQKLAYLTRNIKYAEAAEYGRGKAILKTATSWKVLGTAIKGLMAINIIVWLASVSAWADKVKKNVEGFKNVVDNGDDLVKSASNTYQNYITQIDKLNSKIAENKANGKSTASLENDRDLAIQNRIVAFKNLGIIQRANAKAKELSDKNEKRQSDINLQQQDRLAKAFQKVGNSSQKATELSNDYYNQVLAGNYYINKGMDAYEKSMKSATSHLENHALEMQKAKVDQEAINQYMVDYNMAAEEAAGHWQKFNEGEMIEGVYAVLSELKKVWIDISNNEDFKVFSQNAIEWWNTSLKPTLKEITEYLKEIGKWGIKGFNWLNSSDLGKSVLTVGALGSVVGVVALKFGKWVTGSKSVLDFLKTLKDSVLPKVTGKIKDLGDESKKAGKKLEESGMSTKTSSPTDPTKSTGGISGENTSWLKHTSSKIKEDATTYARAAVGIAAGMVLITEAIILLELPMWGLAKVGDHFEHLEPGIRKGIKGLQLIAPVMAVFLPPIVALMYIMKHYDNVLKDGAIGKATLASAKVIAAGMFLVSEAIFLMVAPMIALAGVGYVKDLLGDSVEKGKAAIEATSDALGALVPVIPLFVIAIGMGLVALSGVGFLAEAAIIASGMLLVSEAIVTLTMPMAAIAALGAMFPNIDGIKKGADAIKVTAEALTYLSTALGAMVLVDWALITHYIDSLIMNAIGINLTDLTKDGGFFTQLNTFITDFNTKVDIKPIDNAKVENLKTAASGMETVGTALESVKTAMDNLPAEFKNGGNGQPALQYNATTGKTSVTGSATEGTGYFDQFKQPLEELGKFIDWFNNTLQFPEEGINDDKLATITQAADMVTQVNTAVDKVKQVMGNIAIGNAVTGIAQLGSGQAGIGEFIGAINPFGSLAASGGGQGDYQSSIGGQLYEMELVLNDLSTFSSNVSGIGGTGDAAAGTSGVAQGLSDMVTAVSDAISQLESTLSAAVPNIKQNANNIGTGIREGIKTGLGDLASIIIPPFVSALQSAKAYATTYGKGVGYNLTEGFKFNLKVKAATESEMNYTIQYLDGQKDRFYNKGAELGDSLSDGYKSKGLQQQSPGLMARSTLQEMVYISESLDEGMTMLPEKAIALGNALTSNFNPSFDIGGISVDELGQFQTGLGQVSSMVDSTNMQTSSAFTDMNTTVATNMQGMTTNVDGAFNNINQNATTSYAKITNTTRTSLKNMQDQTTKNINGIKSSWRDMQAALIASAENIRNETSSKIQSLESNMASFWSKVQNPGLLLSGSSRLSGNRSIRRTGNVSRSLTGRLMAGSSPKTGISNSFKPRGNSELNAKMREKLAEYLQCLLTDGYCASGWSFNWTPKIMNALTNWKTHFGEIYDPYLNVGKFQNDSFPVRGIKEIALNYISDAIGRTSYEHYYNYKYGSPGNPLPAWNAGHFNCVEGAEVAIGLANSFGFGGGYIGYGTWDGEGHGFAVIPGLGVIDATAIQQGYGLRSPKVQGYPAAGSRTISPSKPLKQGGVVIEGGVNVHVVIQSDVKDAKETGEEIGKVATNKIIDMLKRSPATGL